MPFDGVAVRALVTELNDEIIESRIERISMPTKNEVVLVLRNYRGTRRLYLSANPSHPSAFLTDTSIVNPPVPPNFCMFLRKHAGGGIIKDVTGYGFERYFSIGLMTRTSLGDMHEKRLMVELTGRNCNIILLNKAGIILDSLKHIDASVSSVREIMPARKYVFIPSQNKTSPDTAIAGEILEGSDKAVSKHLLTSLTGFSPVLCREICHRAACDPDIPLNSLDFIMKTRLTKVLSKVLDDISGNKLSPCIVIDDSGKFKDFHCIALTQYKKLKLFTKFNKAVSDYFIIKRNQTNTSSGKTDLVRAVNKNIKRCLKKVALHAGIVDREKTVEDIKLFGELITANIHNIKKGTGETELLNYYTGANITVKLDPNKSAVENAQRYYKKYRKTKSAIENSKVQLKDSQHELSYLESVSHWLDTVNTPDETKAIRQELATQGYIKKKHPRYKKKEEKPSFNPHKYISSEGYEIYAGRNNTENDYLTFKFANSKDLWLHVKGIPGSHVIVRKKDRHLEFIPDKTISEAAMIAVWHSKARKSGKTAVDYSEVRNIKKPKGAKPGMVNYFDYFSAYAAVDEQNIDSMRAD